MQIRKEVNYDCENSLFLCTSKNVLIPTTLSISLPFLKKEELRHPNKLQDWNRGLIELPKATQKH
jgi:hypothetical protein